MALKITQGLYSFVLILITAMLSKYFTDKGLISFYDSLAMPDATPPRMYFAYAWGLIYFLLFLSFYIVLRSKSEIENFKDANALFIMQLFLQILWCFSFFYMEQLWAGVIVIIALDIVVAMMLQTFACINLWSFWLLVPYMAWLLFATYLNLYAAMFN